MMMHARRGYILFLTVSVIGVMTLIATQIFHLGGSYNQYIPLIIEREQAKQLALSGVSIASAQLLLQDKQFYSSKKSDKEKLEGGKTTELNRKQLLKTLLMVQNQWQEFALTGSNDGFDGSIKICISCESGKINLNKLYDRTKKTFTATGVNTTTEGFVKYTAERMREWFKDIDTVSVITDVIKKRKTPFVTPFDLLAHKKCGFFSNVPVYFPSTQEDKDAPSLIYLNDLFTVYSDDCHIDPLLLSSSLRLLFGFKTVQGARKKEDIEQLIEKLPLANIQWETVWDTILKELTGKEFKSVPKELIPLLNSKFEPRVFSVISVGKIGRAEQKLLAILERATENKQDIVTIKQIYWL